jgi:hypothetical protein
MGLGVVFQGGLFSVGARGSQIRDALLAHG